MEMNAQDVKIGNRKIMAIVMGMQEQKHMNFAGKSTNKGAGGV